MQVTETATHRELTVGKSLYFFYFGAVGVILSNLPYYYASIGLTGTQIGLISAIPPAVSMLFSPLWGLLNDRFEKPRLWLGLAVVGSLLALNAIGLIQYFPLLLVVSGIYALFNGSLMPVIDALNLRLLGGQRDHYGRQRVWGSVSFIVTSWGVSAWLASVGVRWLFPAYTVCMILLLVALSFLRSGRPGSAVKPARRPLLVALRSLVRNPRWLFYSASLFLLTIGTLGMSNFLPVYLRQLGAGTDLIGRAYSVGAIVELPFLFFGAWIVQHLGIKRMLAIAYVMYAVRFLLIAMMPDPSWAVPIALLNSVTYGLNWIAGVLYVSRLAPDDLKTTTQSLMIATTNFSSVVGAPISGWMYDRFGPSTQFQVYSALALVALVVMLVGFQTRNRRED